MRSFVNCVVVLTTILLFITPVIHAQTCPWQESGLSWWSIPSSWPSGSVPVAGQNVFIPSGVKMVYDVPPPGVVYGAINISSGGQLILSGKSSVTLSATSIFVADSAAFRIGSASCPYPYTANVVLYGPYDAVTSIGGMGNKGILSMGLLDFYGIPPQPTWTRVASTVNVGATSFTVQDSLKNWKVGDTIVLTTTDYYQELSERFTIVAITGSNITVNKPVAFLHWGANGEFAEVGHISRNVRIQGDNSSESSQFGGHVILKGNATGHIYGVEFTKMGQSGFVGRYPFHFHIMGDQAGKGHFVSENAFHDNYQRCFTVHGTSGILARNNVGYNTTGHCYFFEEGSETNNYYDHNLGIYLTPGKLIPTDSRPSVFWITNPNNTFVNNAAAGGSFGFWFSLPQTPLGLTSYMSWIKPRSTQLKQFDNNLAHSAQENGIHFDEGPYADGTTNIFVYLPLADSSNPSSSPVRTTFNNNISYKNRGYGIWMRGSYLTLNNATMIDNGVGCNLVSYGNLVQNSLFIGETPNIGTPGRTDWFYDMGRSRPQIWFLYYPIHGFEFYDNTGAQFSRNNTFVNFTSNQYRDAGAFGAIQFGPYVLPATVVATQSTLINSNQWTIRANSFSNDGPTHVVVQDADGSLTGSYGSYIVSNNSILYFDNNCTMYSAWENFYLCQKNENAYSQIAVENLDVAGTDFGNSTSMTYRAWYTPLGRPDVQDWITGGAVSSKLRYLYGANVISRRGYVLGFPHPTPYKLQLNMRYPASGEWVVLVLAYPKGTTFNLTRGYYGVPLTQVYSLSLLNKWTFYYDSNLQYLYTMYQEEDGLLNSTAGFAQYDWGSDSVVITASCGKLCIVSPNQPIPPALADNEDKYRAVLKGCYAGVSNKYEGTAYLNYNPVSHQLTYVIHHNIPQATFATFQSLTNGLVYDTLVAQSPIRGMFNVSWNRLNELWNGNWSMSIGTGTTVQLKGFFKCAGICSTPPMISSSDYCATIPGEAQVYTDSLNSTIGWMDWSYGVTRTFNYTGDKRCEQNSLMTVFSSYGAMLFNVGLGSCAPGACTAYWMKPWVSMSTYSFFQFLIKSPTGPLNYPLFVTAQYTNQSFIGAIYLDPKYIDNGVIENSWTRVKIPVKDIGFVGNELIGTLGVQLRGYPPNSIPLLFDNIKLVPAYSDPLTKGPAGSAQSLTVTQC